MKKRLTLLSVALLSIGGAMAQNAIRIEREDTLTILTDELRSIVFEGDGYHEVITLKNGETINTQSNKLQKIDFRGNNINATFRSGEKKTFAISDLQAMSFATDASDVEMLENDKAIIVYNAQTQMAYTINTKEKGLMQLFNCEGKLLKQMRDNQISLQGLPTRLYVVSYNHKLYAKIKK